MLPSASVFQSYAMLLLGLGGGVVTLVVYSTTHVLQLELFVASVGLLGGHVAARVERPTAVTQ